MNLDERIHFSRVPTNEIHLHVAEAGPSGGPLVFLLHGFPEFWYGWRNQILPLADQGFHVIAPDQRGYNLSDKPTGISNYSLDHLSADILGLANHFGRETFAVAGHDWGACVGWWLAGRHPDRVERLAVLNAPHPAVWLQEMRSNPVQRRRSSYVRLLQMPYLPEFLIGLNRSRALSRAFRDSVRPGAFTDADLAEYRKAWAQSGAITAMINYYRALSNDSLLPPEAYRISRPVMTVWGKRDAYVVPELAEASMKLCEDGRLVWLDQATHWVQHDEPDRVTTLLYEFLKA